MTPDLPAEVQDHIVRGAHDYLARWRRDLDSDHFDAVVAVVAPEIARPLLERAEHAEALIVEEVAHVRQLEAACDQLQARITELEAEAAGARTALANADQALDTLFARVEALVVALTELVGLHNSGANGGRMVDAAWDNARAALAAGEEKP